MKFNIVNKKGNEELNLIPEHVYVVGYSGSNKEKIYEHIKELEEQLNVAPPKKIPTVFEVSKEILTQDKNLYFVCEKTSGECEFVIIIKNSKIYIGLGSDHSDRELEAISVPKAKQICLKPISYEIWEYEEIKDHFSKIKLSAKSDSKDYQIGTLADIISVEEILDELKKSLGGPVDNCVIFSGTVPLVAGYEYGKNFYLELNDEILERKIAFDYDINVIPDEAR
ncbi:DUF2848 family protein [Fusobacterium sp. PH5-44]|uniref:DUF2848 family protein n=1 Tax=unclassified Fusobacterium TaxID=2648384 RepID=UPI003D23A6CE